MQSIRCYTSYFLNYRDVEELLEERGVALDHATVNRWVVKYSLLLELKFCKHKKKIGSSWRMNETYIKIKGRWVYYYRAVDTDNQIIDFYLSEKRDTKAACSFFTKAIGSNGLPDKVNLAGLQAINQGLPEDRRIMVRQIKYLNNLIEQEHRPIKRITRPMLGFKAFTSAVATLAGIELQRMLKNGQGILNSDLPAWKQFYALAG